jgi:hypothetical protein
MFTVIAGKPEGLTPGMVLRDSAGVVWFVKIDPPGFPELATGAEIVAGRLLWAAGWHVPETHIVDLDIALVQLAPTATAKDRYGRTVRMTTDDVKMILGGANPRPGGKVRALFSRRLPGRALGPFDWRGVRRDDPNDRLPHERRRSLRGLWVFFAWLNNTDTRRQNTLDTFVPVAGERGHVRHWILDLGDSLGSSATREKYASEGYEYQFPLATVLGNALSAGLRYPYWNRVRRSKWRAVGVFESEVFDPARWRPQFLNPAFVEAAPEDTFWAAAILARIDREHVRAAVGAAGYSEPGAADWIGDVLMARRGRLLAHAFRNMLALVDPSIDDGYRLRLTDVDPAAGRAPRYRWSVRWNRTRRGDRTLGRGGGAHPEVDLRPLVSALVAGDAAGFAADPFLTVSLWRARGDRRGPRVDVHVRVVGTRVVPVAVEREVASW